jgi:hypothetical protein
VSEVGAPKSRFLVASGLSFVSFREGSGVALFGQILSSFKNDSGLKGPLL